jgi:signal transduction histidine kinase
MKQVLLNLTLNALESLPSDAGTVAISLTRRGDHVELSITDTGRGMPPDVLDRVFEPFFTTKRGASSPGTGLGLSISHAIVESHQGMLTAHSGGPSRGSRFTLTLRAADESSRSNDTDRTITHSPVLGGEASGNSDRPRAGSVRGPA